MLLMEHWWLDYRSNWMYRLQSNSLHFALYAMIAIYNYKNTLFRSMTSRKMEIQSMTPRQKSTWVENGTTRSLWLRTWSKCLILTPQMKKVQVSSCSRSLTCNCILVPYNLLASTVIGVLIYFFQNIPEAHTISCRHWQGTSKKQRRVTSADRSWGLVNFFFADRRVIEISRS